MHTDAEISLSQAVLGGTIRVQGVYEDQNIQVSFFHFKFLILFKNAIIFLDNAWYIITCQNLFNWQRFKTC